MGGTAATTTLGWSSQGGPAGSATTYTVVTGPLSELTDDDGFTSACSLAVGLGSAQTTDTRLVPPGEGFYYLVRAENACGAGTFGRVELDAAPPVCQTPPQT